MSAVGTSVVEATTFGLEQTKKRRITPRVRRAVELMVNDGLKREEAATKAGLQDNSLYIALRRPEVLAFRNDLMQVLRTSAASRTISRVDKLADDAESEHVKLEANKWLAGLDGITPPERGNSLNVQVNIPGLQLVFAAPEAAQIIEGQAIEVQPNDALPAPIAHPALAQKPQE